MGEVKKGNFFEQFINTLRKKFGDGIIFRLDEETVSKVETFSSGSIGLDIALGIGGYPRGRIIEIFGQESSGKTTIALQAIAEVQKLGEETAFIDAEYALDRNYARNLGVDISKLLVSQPDCGEQAIDIVEDLIASGMVKLVVIDSVAALVPKDEIAGEMEDAQIGLHARLMSKGLRRLAPLAAKNSATIIFINQIRNKIGGNIYQNETTTGGNALKFYTSVRLDVKKIGSIKDGEEIIGNRVRVKVVKNKLASPFKEAEFEIYYGKGIVKNAEAFDLGVEFGLIEKSGSWCSFQGNRLGQGKQAAISYLSENLETSVLLYNLIAEKKSVVAR